MSALDVVAKREEGVGAKGDIGLLRDPLFLLGQGQRLRTLGEPLLPLAIGQNVLVLVRRVNIDSVVAVRTANVFNELQTQNLRMLAQIPVVSFIAGKTRAMDAALLAGADTDCQAVLHVAHGVRLGVLQRDLSHHHVDLRLISEFFVLSDDIVKLIWGDGEVVMTLLERHAEHVLALNGSAHVVRVDLNDVVLAALLGFQDLKRLVGESRGDDAVGDFPLQVVGNVSVAHIGKSSPVAVAAKPIGAARANVSRGNGRKLVVGRNVVDEIHLPVDVGQRMSNGGTSRRNVLEGGSRREAGCGLQFADQLPRIEGIQEVDVAGTAVQHRDGQVGSVLHEDTCRLLIRVAAVLKLELVHRLVPQILVEDGDVASDVRVKRDLVVGIQSRPNLFRGAQGDLNGLAGESRQRVAVALIGGNEVATAFVNTLISKELTQAATVLLMLQNGDLERAVLVDDGGDTRGEIRGIGLELALHAARAEVACVDDGVGLITVGDHQFLAHCAHRMVDDQARVNQLRRIVSLGADAVLGFHEHAVAAVLAAPHDEVVHAVLTHHNASAGIRIALKDIDQILHALPFCLTIRPNEKRQAPAYAVTCPDGRLVCCAAPPW